MTVEVVFLVIAGFLAGSFALLALGGDSFIELISGVAVVGFLRKQAAGSSHLGMRTARFSSVLLIALIPTVSLGAGYSYLTGIRAEASPLGITIAIGAVIVMPYLWIEKKKIGRETRCLPLSTDSIESATCFLMAVVLLGGLLAVYLLGLWWIDYLATAGILAFVGKEAIEAFRGSHENHTSE